MGHGDGHRGGWILAWSIVKTCMLQVLALCGVGMEWNGMEWNGHEWNELAQSFVTFLLVSSQLLCLSIEGHHHNESCSEWVQTERNVLLHS